MSSEDVIAQLDEAPLSSDQGRAWIRCVLSKIDGLDAIEKSIVAGDFSDNCYDENSKRMRNVDDRNYSSRARLFRFLMSNDIFDGFAAEHVFEWTGDIGIPETVVIECLDSCGV